MISPKQSGYYVLCSYPFLALFFSSLLSERVNVIASHLLQARRIKLLLITSYVVIVFSLGMMIYNFKSFYRDQEKIELVDEVSQLVGNEKKLSIDWNLQSDYSLKCYFYKRHYISAYTPNYTWVHTHLLLTTEPMTDKKLVRTYLIDNRRVYLYSH
jgi:cell division protein FtsL